MTFDDTDYSLLAQQLQAMLDGESDALANSSNFTALLYDSFDGINWAGIYVLRGGELVLGPFQGKPACVRIPLGKGVCGTAAQERKTLNVPDVHAFDGHIACDAASRSEIVVPLIRDGELLGVLDIDSPHVARFNDDDRHGLESICETFIALLGHTSGERGEFI